MQARVTGLLLAGRKVTENASPEETPSSALEAFLERLRAIRVLDPACGSGNFLFVTLGPQGPRMGGDPVGLAGPPGARRVPEDRSRGGPRHRDQPLRGRAGPGHDLDRRDPVDAPPRPRLPARPDPQPLDNIETRDALLDLSDPANPREAEWPAAEFIVGNPPFLGAKLLRRGLGDDYVETLFGIFGDRLPGMADLSAYWHEKARAAIAAGRTKRAGLLATQSIRGGGSRRALQRIKETGRHLLRPLGRPLGPLGRERPHQLRRPGRRERDGPRARRPSGQLDQREPDFGGRCHSGAPASREPGDRVHRRPEERPVRHR